MADLSWSELVGGSVAGALAGIGATFKAMQGKQRPSVSRDEYYALRERVLVLEVTLPTISATLQEIRGDIAAIKAALAKEND